jgi:hypothetical protein
MHTRRGPILTGAAFCVAPLVRAQVVAPFHSAQPSLFDDIAAHPSVLEAG